MNGFISIKVGEDPFVDLLEKCVLAAVDVIEGKLVRE